MNKQLDDTAITNELKGASAFFEQPQLEVKNPPSTNDKENKPNARTAQPNGPSERPEDTASGERAPEHKTDGLDFMDDLHTSEREGQHTRTTQRYSFEIYSDQVELIDEIKYLYRRKSGAKLSASKILRDLIDERLPEVLGQLAGSNGNGGKVDRK